MSYGVQGFFDNGGKRCFVGRVVKTDPPLQRAFLQLNPQITLHAVGRGTWGNRVFVRISRAKQADPTNPRTANWVRVRVYYYKDPMVPNPPLDPDVRANLTDPTLQKPDVLEDFDNLSLDRRASNSIDTAVNAGSQLIRVEYTGDSLTSIPTPDQMAPLANGQDGGGPMNYAGTADAIDNNAKLFGQGTGLLGMDTVDEVALLVAPDHVNDPNLTQALVTDCERLRDRFAVLSADRNFANTGRPPFDTTFGALYHPWIKIYDPYTRDDIYVPPAGHVAGVIARTDIEQGVHKAPANAVLVGAKDLFKPIPKEVQDLLNPVGVNCMRDFRADRRGIRVWGARTMTSDPEWKYVNVRRLFLMIEESIDQGTQWVVFEPNAPATWARVVRAITNFLTTLWRNGALFGATPAEAFFVRCDRTTMTDDDIENGRLICYVGVAPVRPAEFVIIRIGQKTADAQA